MSDIYRDAQIRWVCPLCKRANAPWVRQCDCKEGINKWGEPIYVPAQWPAEGTAAPLPKPTITITDNGTTAPTNDVIWTHANFQESLERSLTENAAVYQALADYDRGADSE